MRRIEVLLDAGHGGWKDGAYVTAPSKMFDHGNGLVIYEGIVNRAIVALLKEELHRVGLAWFDILDASQDDVPLDERVRRANEHSKQSPYFSFYLSVHANAGGGTGLELFTSKGKTASDGIAQCIANALIHEFPDERWRGDLSDFDLDKEKNYYVLKNTSMPAVLLELFFMDHQGDAQKIRDHAVQRRAAQALARGIKSYEKQLNQ